MPLLKKARIEVYLPRGNTAAYRRLRAAFEKEFLETFGGHTVVADIKGSYLNAEGETDIDTIDLVYVDVPFDLDENRAAMDDYVSALQDLVLETTPEESVLIVVHEIFHAASD